MQTQSQISMRYCQPSETQISPVARSQPELPTHTVRDWPTPAIKNIESVHKLSEDIELQDLVRVVADYHGLVAVGAIEMIELLLGFGRLSFNGVHWQERTSLLLVRERVRDLDLACSRCQEPNI